MVISSEKEQILPWKKKPLIVTSPENNKMRSAVISKSISVLSWGHRISIFRVNYLVDGRGFLAVPPSRSVVSREFFLLHSPFAYLRWTLVDRQKQKRWWRRRQKQVAPGEKSYCIEWPQTMSVLIFILLSRFTAILMDMVCYFRNWGEFHPTTAMRKV